MFLRVGPLSVQSPLLKRICARQKSCCFGATNRYIRPKGAIWKSTSQPMLLSDGNLTVKRMIYRYIGIFQLFHWLFKLLRIKFTHQEGNGLSSGYGCLRLELPIAI